MPQSRPTSPTSPSAPQSALSRTAADHLPPKPSSSMTKKPLSRTEGVVVCKKRKRSTERREQKVSIDAGRVYLAQRLRHHDDALTSDRHARSDLWRASSHRKEQHRSGSPTPNNHKDIDGHSLHSLKSPVRRSFDDKGKEISYSLPSLNNNTVSGSENTVDKLQPHPSQVEDVIPSVASVDRFLDSINLSSATSCNPAITKSKAPLTPTQQVLPPTPVSIAPVPLPLPGSPGVDLEPIPFTFGPERLSLLHHGHPLNYDLNLLPDDPIGPITLLGATQSEPGAYLVVGAHYRRTGRSRAACEVIKALLGKHAPFTRPDDLMRENKENAPLYQASTSPPKSHVLSVLTSIDVNTPAHQAAVMRPSFLLLAACQLDISRECLSPIEKIKHANAAEGLFRAVYGTKNDDIDNISESGQTTDTNALGLAFTDLARVPSTVGDSTVSSVCRPTSTCGVPTAPASTRILVLEEELRVMRAAKCTLEADVAAANKRQERTDQCVKEAESRSRDALRLLEDERDELGAVKRRLVETEQKMSDMEQSAAGAETRVWARLRDMIYGSARGL